MMSASDPTSRQPAAEQGSLSARSGVASLAIGLIALLGNALSLSFVSRSSHSIWLSGETNEWLGITMAGSFIGISAAVVGAFSLWHTRRLLLLAALSLAFVVLTFSSLGPLSLAALPFIVGVSASAVGTFSFCRTRGHPHQRNKRLAAAGTVLGGLAAAMGGYGLLLVLGAAMSHFL